MWQFRKITKSNPTKPAMASSLLEFSLHSSFSSPFSFSSASSSSPPPTSHILLSSLPIHQNPSTAETPPPEISTHPIQSNPQFIYLSIAIMELQCLNRFAQREDQIEGEVSGSSISVGRRVINVSCMLCSNKVLLLT